MKPARRLLAIACVVLVPQSLAAQPPADATPNGSQTSSVAASSPAFEVASIRPNVSGAQSPYLNTADGFAVTGGSLTQLIAMAYGFWGVPDFEKDRLFGAPDWIRQARYDVAAKVAEADIPELSKLTPEQRRQMLRPILEDRFKLEAHTETRVFSTYRLVVAKGGAKLQEAEAGHVYADKLGGGGTGANRMSSQRGIVTAQGIALSTLANFLTQTLGRPVVDETNLSGRYDFTLHYSPESMSAQLLPSDSSTPQPNSGGPSILTALQEQLGLQIESGKAQMQVLVIDHIERPSAN